MGKSLDFCARYPGFTTQTDDRSMDIRVSQKNNFFEKYRCSGLIWFS